MGDYYEILREIHEATEAYYLDQDHYDTEDDLNDWFSGTSPWEEPEGYEAPF